MQTARGGGRPGCAGRLAATDAKRALRAEQAGLPAKTLAEMDVLG